MSLRRFIKNESGATAIEYALIAAATAIPLVAVLGLMSSNLGKMYSSIAGTLTLN